MNTKIVILIAVLLLIASVFATQPCFAQSNQSTSSVVLNHLNVLITYPANVLPGQSVTMNVTAQAKDDFQLASLTVIAYSADQNNLQPLLSTIVAENLVMLSGQQVSKQIQLTVPSGAPRTSLVAQVIESIGAAYLPYSPYTTSMGSYTYTQYSPYNYPYSYYNYQYAAYPNNCYYGSYCYAYGYPSTYYSLYPYSDDAIAPLSYVLATTPEDAALQSQNQQLRNQTQQLQQQIQNLQNSTAQKDSIINSLNSQLASLQGTTTLMEIIAAILAIALVAVAALHFKSTRTAKSQTSEA